MYGWGVPNWNPNEHLLLTIFFPMAIRTASMDAKSPTARVDLNEARLSETTCEDYEWCLRLIWYMLRHFERRELTSETSFEVLLESSIEVSSPSSLLLSIVMTPPSTALAFELLLVFLVVAQLVIWGDVLEPFLSLLYLVVWVSALVEYLFMDKVRMVHWYFSQSNNFV